MCIKVELLCSLDNQDCETLAERLKQGILALSTLLNQCVEFTKILIPMTRDWLKTSLPILIVRNVNEKKYAIIELKEPSYGEEMLNEIMENNVLVSEVHVLNVEAIAL